MSGFGKATWLHFPKGGPDAVRAVARRLADAGFEVVIPCVYHPDGYANFQSRIAAIRPAIATWDPLEVLCDEANRVGLDVHAWNCVFTEGDASTLRRQHPDWMAYDRDGREATGVYGDTSGWACPARPEVQDYQLAIYQELLDNYDLAAVHLDYIRYRDASLCYCPRCRAEFKRQFDADPVDIDAAHPRISDWIDWRVAHITRFVERLRERTNAAGKQVSAAVFADYPNCVWGVGQDWEDWGRRGLIDVMIPMNYSPTAAIAAKRTRNHVHALDGAVPLWEGLNILASTTTAVLVRQIEAVLAEGAQGVTIFEYSGLYGRPLSDNDIKAIRAIG